ncbi:organic cation transporter protein-like [Bombus vancouverensis nearcticus]|uniref:organic cation transporter protein-like n=1 Tax=Bombus vancouverensis nearcticus TaxID=2705178 RepID=UPI00402BDDD6
MTCIVTSVPLVLAVGTPWLIPESARWLVSQGQIDRAIKILGKFERINGTKVPDDIYRRFRVNKPITAIFSVFSTFMIFPALCAFYKYQFICLFTKYRMAISLVFDGHVRNVDNLGLDVFVTFTIAAATELPADTFLTLVLDRWGRRWLACGSLVISGIFSIWASAVSNSSYISFLYIHPSIYTASLAILGRFWINISYNIGLQYAAEVLPTVVRAQGVALIHIMGYVASILAPFVVYLNVVSSFQPLLVLGTLGIMGGLLTLFLPETLNKDLPQTLQDSEDFGKDQKIWDVPCIGRKREDEETPPVAMFRSFSRCSARNSMRASLRGEPLRSSMLRRSSIKSRKSENSITEVERL